ncbi:MAG: hypothetical protein D6819_07845 [Gammaproteobacteria bacterium]|nr:MAG: hypothetical protein D6819_07845 [Gammaproteobacteria bacterium]
MRVPTPSQARQASARKRQEPPRLGASLPAPLRRPPARKGPDVAPIFLRVRPGITEMIAVSASMPNRIATPFKEPQVVDASGSQIQTMGGNVYILPASKAPIGIFISEKDARGPVISLTLVPKDIPPQNVLVQFEATEPGAERGHNKPDSHADTIVHVMRRIVMGELPDGYTEAPEPGKLLEIGPVLAKSSRRWAGTDTEVLEYLLENRGSEAVELTEPSFYERGVKAVAFYPKIMLRPGETTRAYVMRSLEGAP